MMSHLNHMYKLKKCINIGFHFLKLLAYHPKILHDRYLQVENSDCCRNVNESAGKLNSQELKTTTFTETSRNTTT